MKNSVVMSFAVVFLALGGAQAEDKKFTDQISGTGAPSSFDSNGDSVPGLYVTFAGRSSIGPVHGGILVEYDFLRAGPHPSCPMGTIKLPVIVSAGNRSVTMTDGQVFLRDDAASALYCLNPSTGVFNMTVKGSFVGGMGRYAGATGSYQYKGTGTILLTDSKGMPFGAFVAETEGRINLPRGRGDD
jgi:hypothetical protein